MVLVNLLLVVVDDDELPVGIQAKAVRSTTRHDGRRTSTFGGETLCSDWSS